MNTHKATAEEILKEGDKIFILDGVDGIMQPYINLEDAYDFVKQIELNILALTTVKKKIEKDGVCSLSKEGSDQWIIRKETLK